MGVCVIFLRKRGTCRSDENPDQPLVGSFHNGDSRSVARNVREALFGYWVGCTGANEAATILNPGFPGALGKDPCSPDHLIIVYGTHAKGIAVL